MRLEWLNRLPPDAAEAELLRCCGSSAWARRMAAGRPYAHLDALLETAERVWWQLGREDWLEAFRAHPRIGERSAAGAASRWAAQEQAGAAGAARSLLDRLAAANRAYEERFGYIFIVCATGKSAEEMLEVLDARLENDAHAELRVAAEEQRRITRLRLLKLLDAEYVSGTGSGSGSGSGTGSGSDR